MRSAQTSRASRLRVGTGPVGLVGVAGSAACTAAMVLPVIGAAGATASMAAMTRSQEVVHAVRGERCSGEPVPAD